MNDLFAFLFSTEKNVGRKDYLMTGCSLMFMKYVVDAALVYAFSGAFFSPLAYLSPLLLNKESLLSSHPLMLLVMGLWTLGFVWVGVALSMRRLKDAGQSMWLVLFFFVPFVNYLAMLIFAGLPTAADSLPNPTPSKVDSVLLSAIMGTVLGAALAVVMTFLAVSVFKQYGLALFVGTPFVMGFTSVGCFNHGKKRSLPQSLLVAMLSVLCGAGLLLLFALEGVLCIVMASPIAMVLTVLGALLGYGVAAGNRVPHALLVLLFLPILAASEPKWEFPLREVATTIEIDAPPQEVWNNVIGFSQLDPPEWWLFELGIAYPIKATLEGTGVGAIRYCEFSTGPFVEPITVWDEPNRLAFSVIDQPPTMKEWSPYEMLDAPHLTEGLQSEKGEFRLIDLRNGKTRLEGSTWYRLLMMPNGYWGLWGDWLIHGIHKRVLRHIKNLSEKIPSTSP